MELTLYWPSADQYYFVDKYPPDSYVSLVLIPNSFVTFKQTFVISCRYISLIIRNI